MIRISNRIASQFLSFLLIMSFLLAHDTVAADTIYAIDLSSPMGNKCNASSSIFEEAKNWIKIDAINHPDRITVIAMGKHSRIIFHSDTSPITLADALDSLEIENTDILSLAPGLREIHKLISDETISTPRVVIISHLDSPDEESIQLILTLQTSGTRFEWFTIDSPPKTNFLAILGFVSTNTLACTNLFEETSATTPDAEIIKLVRTIAAEESGMDFNLVPADSDLIKDLGLDQLGAFEVLARSCEMRGVTLPDKANLTKISEIAQYLTLAPRDGTRRIRGDSPLEATDPVYIQTVFFGTNRSPENDPRYSSNFGGERAFDKQISYGICHVSIPVLAHEQGKVESPFLGLDILSDPKKHIVLRDVITLDRESFFGKLREQLAAGRPEEEWSHDILVFIHGFNVLFNEAARRTAQIAYDLGFTGAPVMFSWPSNGKLYAYISDREDVEWSIPYIAHFLEDLASRAQPRRIHLITHSMGSEGTLRALQDITLRRGLQAGPLFENIILAAPDFDAIIFSDQIAPEIKGIARRWTIYSSDKDTALNVSASLRFAPRLGIPIPLAEGIDTIDATGIEVTPWSVPEFHSYFATKQRVIADMKKVLLGVAPESRDLVTKISKSIIYWALLPITPAQLK